MQARFQAFFKPVSNISRFFNRGEQPNHFDRLPDDLVIQITKQALPADVYEGLPALLAMSVTDKRMRRLVQSRLQQLKELRQCWYITTNRLDLFVSHPSKKRPLIPLNCLSPVGRQEVIRELSARPEEITSVLDGLCPQLAFFTPEQRQNLLQSVLSLPYAAHRAEAIGKFAANGMSSLTPGQRGQLLDAALNLRKEVDKAEALKGFGRGLEHLPPEQRQTVIEATLNIRNAGYRGNVIGGLGSGLKHLTREQRSLLVESTLSNPEEWGRANTVHQWGPEAMPELTRQQRNSLVNMACNLRNPESKEWAFYGLGKNLPLFTPEQRERLIHEPVKTLTIVSADGLTETLEPESINPKVFGEQLSHLTPMQRARLVNATLNLRSPYNQIQSIGALARGGLNHLTPEQRQALVNIVLEFPESWDRMKGIRKLAIGGLEHLTPEQRDTLVQEAVCLPQSYERQKAVSGVARGGLQHLTPEQRATLVTAVLNLKKPANRARGINGIGRGGLEHLTAEQRDSLVRATRELPGRNRTEAIIGLGVSWKDLTPEQRESLLTMTRYFDSPSNQAKAMQGIIEGILKMDKPESPTTSQLYRGERHRT